MPSSVSTAASSVTSQSGCGFGPRWVGIDWSQVDQRSPSGRPSVASNTSIGGSDRCPRTRLAVVGSSSSKRCLPRRRAALGQGDGPPVLNSPRRAEGKSCTGGAPQLSGEQGRRECARDGPRHVAPPFAQPASAGPNLLQVAIPSPAVATGFPPGCAILRALTSSPV